MSLTPRMIIIYHINVINFFVVRQGNFNFVLLISFIRTTAKWKTSLAVWSYNIGNRKTSLFFPWKLTRKPEVGNTVYRSSSNGSLLRLSVAIITQRRQEERAFLPPHTRTQAILFQDNARLYRGTLHSSIAQFPVLPSSWLTHPSSSSTWKPQLQEKHSKAIVTEINRGMR